MLPYVADQKYAVGGAKPGEEFAHLIRTCQARFIDKVEMSALWHSIGLRRAGKETLQSSGFDASFTELARSARRGRKTLHIVPLSFDCGPDGG
jgi:hypothetical protein